MRPQVDDEECQRCGTVQQQTRLVYEESRLLHYVSSRRIARHDAKPTGDLKGEHDKGRQRCAIPNTRASISVTRFEVMPSFCLIEKDK